jgi:glycogen operon protein
MIAFRKAHPSIARSQYWREDVRWFGRTGPEVDLSPEGQALAYFLNGARLNDDDIYVMVNAGADEAWFHVQEGKAHEWLLVVDTGLPSPLDIAGPDEKRLLESSDYPVKARSVVVLCRESKPGAQARSGASPASP